MEPLRKLRQDCTAPSIFQRSSSNPVSVKKLLTPNELLNHLIKDNEMNCKSELRSIISCLNGLAGIYIIREEVLEAIKMYKNVLQRAKEKVFENINVDTLQQIHALYNLIKVIEENNLEENDVEEYKHNFAESEWKYIDSYYSLVNINLLLYHKNTFDLFVYLSLNY